MASEDIDGSSVVSRDGELVVRRRADGETGISTLTLTPASGHPSPAVVGRLAREFSIRSQLDSGWAVTPIRLETDRRKQTLVLRDPGGQLLEQQLTEPMSTAHFLGVSAAMASAVRQMHDSGLIHRDLKPANFLVDDDAAAAYLTGFGYATDHAGGREAPPSIGVIAGTFEYMAPEQTGRMNRSVDARSDLYSLGVVYYRMLTGTLPFMANNPLEWVYAHIAREPVPPATAQAEVPGPVSAIVMKLLAKNAEERYQTAAGLESDLSRCLGEWRSAGRVSVFPLAADDVSTDLLIPEKLYGRERESRVLTDALHRVVDTGTSELLLISGYSGVGKSALVHELMKESVAQHTLFVSGKYDQHKRDTPFSTFAQAFSTLVRQILRQGEKEISDWRAAIAGALGRNGRVLVDIIPELEWLIGPQPEVLALGPTEARNRFQSACLRFITACATADHPIVLFLDDLQWIDLASLALVEHMAVQPEVRHLLFVGAYRDNAVSADHPLIISLDALRRTSTIVTDVVLAPLRVDDVQDLVADATRADPADSEQLARLVHRKTGGNPFFSIQFLSSVWEERLLRFDRRSRKWTADIDRIESLGYTDNVVDLMVAKLQRLPGATLQTVKGLSCLGHRSPVSTLALIEAQEETVVAENLAVAVQAGLVAHGDDGYRFAHDRIQEAAYSLIPAESLAARHLGIGRVLLAGEGKAIPDERLFEIVDHLDHGVELITDAEERQAVCDLAFAAGRKAKRAVAFASARAYFDRARLLLPDDAWDRRGEATLALHLELLECEFVTGNESRAEQLFHETLERAASALQRARVLGLRMRLHQGAGRLEEALGFGLEALQLFGMSFPDSSEETLSDFLKEQQTFQTLLDGRNIEDLLDLPVATDAQAKATMAILAVMGSCAYNARPALAPLLYCRALNIALEWGNTEASCMSYISYGSFMVSRGDISSASAFAQLGLRLNERFGDLGLRGTLLYVQGAHVNIWTEHLATSMPILEEGFRACREVGNFVFANFNATGVLSIALETGERLSEVARVARQYGAFAQETRNEPVRQWFRFGTQLARNLTGATATATTLDDARFSEKTSLAILTKAKFYTGIANLHLTRMMALVFQARFEEALVAAEHCAKTVNALRSGPLEVTYHYLHCLILAALYSTVDAQRQVEFKAVLDEKRKALGRWAAHCPQSFQNRFALVSAEVARIEGRDLDAEKHYDEAVVSAREHGFVQNEGLSAECASRFYRRRGLSRIARAYLLDARSAYLRWGATAVVDRLDREVPDLVPGAGSGPNDVARTKVEHLDLMAVLQASQAVSDEIVFARLIETLLTVSIEHAGADRGILLLLEEGELRIVAEASAAREGVTVNQKQTAPVPSEIPVAVLGYVTRTHERVVVDDARAEHPFSADPYFGAQHPRSVLCLPLLKQSRLVGIQYLENHLAPGVFSEDRTTVLELLASQAAISIENAALYADLQREQTSIRELNAHLEQRVAERTVDLDQALSEQQAILNQLAERTRDVEAARDHADRASLSKSEFLANMSHEIRTPINAITGFTTLALRTGLDDKQTRYLNGIRESAHGLLRIINDLLDFSKIEAGRLEMEERPFRLAEVVDSVVGQLGPLAEEKGLRFVTQIGDRVPPVLVGDPLRLGQVLLNLCGNAIKFTETGEVGLQVDLEGEKQETCRISFAVTDTGIGLSAEQVGRLFQPFTQADASITRRFGGTGLGLVICQRLVDMMRGRIWVESELGEGATFFFVVELEAMLRDEDSARQSATARFDVGGQLPGVRLLVVEDQPMNREIATELLEQEGATVTLAENGRVALDTIEREGADGFDAVLLDLQMPEMDGYETARRIRRLRSADGLPVLAMTAHVMREERERCLAAGMQDHLAKPIEPDLMTAKLVHWIGPERLTLAAERSSHRKEVTSSPLPSRILDLPFLDLASGLKRCGGNTDLYLRLLAQFPAAGRAAAEALERSVREGNLDEARRQAHGLRGISATLGVRDVSATAGELERELATETTTVPDSLRGLIRSLKAVADQLLAALAAESIEASAQVADPEGEPPDLQPMVRELVACLKRGDLAAEKRFAELQELAAGQEPPWLEPTRLAIEDLDFEVALAALPKA